MNIIHYIITFSRLQQQLWSN